MSTHVAQALLEHNLLHQFHDLLSMVEEHDERFFWWNDIYFMTVCQDVRFKKLIKDPRISQLVEMLLYRKPPKTVHHPLFEHKILAVSGEKEKTQLIKKIREKVSEMEAVLKKHGSGKEWILADIPDKDVVFTRGLDHIVKKRSTDNLYREVEPVKVVSKAGKPSLLVERDNTLMKHLSGFINFVPSVYANDAAILLLKQRGLIEK
jgi:hypothetical protein